MEYIKEPTDFIVEEITPDGLVLEVSRDWEFQGGQGEHLVCVLEKINWDTNRALKVLARTLHVSVKRIGFAGTKDKKAWTTQRISIWGIKPEDLSKVKIKDLWVKPLGFGERIQLGHLWGNRFTIKLSGVDPARFEHPREFWVPNFFGIQRFGEKRPVTHLVGKALVRGQIEEAVKLYLAWPGPEEREETKKARERLAKDWNWREALRYFPRHLSYERTILDHLAKYPRDYANALRRLPKNLLKMFVHAYQAFLFNKYLKTRMARIGLDPTSGDILIDGVPTGPLYGWEMKLAEGRPGEIEREILGKEGLDLANFGVRQLPEASSRGGRRKIAVLVRDYEILERGKDWVKVRFKLEKGAYATTVLDWILGKEPFC